MLRPATHATRRCRQTENLSHVVLSQHEQRMHNRTKNAQEDRRCWRQANASRDSWTEPVLLYFSGMSDDTRSIALDPVRVTATIDQLYDRISDRFPDSGLSKVCRQLAGISRKAQQRSDFIRRPAWGLRLLTALLILVILGVVAATLYSLGAPQKTVGLLDFVPILDSALNDVVLVGAAIFFLVTLEIRLKRSRALESLHELRSIAHLIDMHQLTKSPERLDYEGRATTHSPRSEMTRFELNRYFDYCSEMLSLTGKVAAIYSQRFNDSVAVASVNDIESLTTGLSRKIWQKIMILQMDDRTTE